jgi:hypothetical protein
VEQAAVAQAAVAAAEPGKITAQETGRQLQPQAL